MLTILFLSYVLFRVVYVFVGFGLVGENVFIQSLFVSE